jgi:hypothetical protein
MMTTVCVTIFQFMQHITIMVPNQHQQQKASVAMGISPHFPHYPIINLDTSITLSPDNYPLISGNSFDSALLSHSFHSVF